MEKSAEAFRTISEVSEFLDTPAHVLRFWESRFSQVKPVKRAGGRRYYRPADLALLGGIKRLLHEDGLTIRGVQKILKERGVRHVAALANVELPGAEDSPAPTPANAPANAPERPATTARDDGRSWPPSPTPDTAAESDELLPDPEDAAAKPAPISRTAQPPRPSLSPGAERRAELERQRTAPEAPMQLDVPTLPRGSADNVRTLGTDKPAPAPAPANPPAATMLRAMDALRARDKKSELMSVYLRLTDLKERLAQSDRPAQK